MTKMTGLDELSKTLDDAQKALAAIDGDIGSVQLNPDDPSSIEAAIQQVDSMIDEKIGGCADNPFVAPLVEGMKERYRTAILDRAAEVRLESEMSEHEEGPASNE